MMTIALALRSAKQQLNNMLEASILLAYVLQCDKAYLIAHDEQSLSESQQQKFATLIKQRAKGVPIAYLVGEREFWSLSLQVNDTVLIPRPETELLIETILSLLPENSLSIIDLGTGSGAIAIALACERPEWQITAVDQSIDALSVAEKNAKRHAPNRISFFHSDWFAAVAGKKFDVIVSNPPYIDYEDEHLSQGDLRFEPKRALSANDNGLADFKRIAAQAKEFLNEKGYIFFEHGYNQAESVQKILTSNGFVDIQTIKDLSMQDRVTLARRK